MRAAAPAFAALLWLVGCQSVADAPPGWPDLLEGADIVILGETHDNAEHHRLQAEIIEAISPDAVVFEMVPTDRTEAANDAVRQ
ncbi:MAG: ChaN family lipoprotein, partial [Litorimonas sp.]